MEFSVSVLDYLGKLNNGVLVLLSIVYQNEYFESTFFYTKEDILLTISDNLENKLGTKIENHPDYKELLKQILKKIAPYNEVINQLKVL
jgi:hypothetical protein